MPKHILKNSSYNRKAVKKNGHCLLMRSTSTQSHLFWQKFVKFVLYAKHFSLNETSILRMRTVLLLTLHFRGYLCVQACRLCTSVWRSELSLVIFSSVAPTLWFEKRQLCGHGVPIGWPREPPKFHSCRISRCHDCWLLQSHLPFYVGTGDPNWAATHYQLSHLISPLIMLKSAIW